MASYRAPDTQQGWLEDRSMHSSMHPGVDGESNTLPRSEAADMPEGDSRHSTSLKTTNPIQHLEAHGRTVQVFLGLLLQPISSGIDKFGLWDALKPPRMPGALPRHRTSPPRMDKAYKAWAYCSQGVGRKPQSEPRQKVRFAQTCARKSKPHTFNASTLPRHD